MDSDKKVNWGRVLILAGAVIAFTIGSGFATGQEIIQYYTAYGVQGIFTVLLFAVCFIYYNYNFAKAGAEEHFEKGNDVYKFYCGKYVGTFMDYYSTIFCYMSFFVMVGGAASTLNQQYGLPSWVGGVVLTALAILTVVGGLNSLVDKIGVVGGYRCTLYRYRRGYPVQGCRKCRRRTGSYPHRCICRGRQRDNQERRT